MGNESETKRRRLFGTRRSKLITVALISVLAIIAFASITMNRPVSSNQKALDLSMSYFGEYYRGSTGLVPERPNSTIFWLYPDNYLTSLAISRYTLSDQNTAGFATALSDVIQIYSSTFPGEPIRSQFVALNSTLASFSCSDNYVLGWSSLNNPSKNSTGKSTIETASNDGGVSCAAQTNNDADFLFLRAVYLHRLGNITGADRLYALGAAEFDGKGIADRAYSTPSSASYHEYQTYKLALFTYASICLGQNSTGTSLRGAEATMLRQQNNTTGGFATRYNANQGVGLAVDTETTALVALALELMINPSGPC